MKGFLYKDLILSKVNLIALGVIVAYFIFACVGVNLSLPANGIDADSDMERLFLIRSLLVGGVFAFSVCIPAIGMDCGKNDDREKWLLYAASLPGGFRRMVSARYVMVILANLVAMAFSSVLIVVCHLAYDTTMRLPYVFMLFLISVMQITEALVLPIVLRGKKKIVEVVQAGLVFLVLFGIYAYIALGDISFFKSEDLVGRILRLLILEEKKLWIIVGCMFAGGALLQYLSYLLTIHLYKKD